MEAQTLTVWRQAERYEVPSIMYVNKMDRKDADVWMTCKSIEKKLQVTPLLLQLPIKENDKLIGMYFMVNFLYIFRYPSMGSMDFNF